MVPCPGPTPRVPPILQQRPLTPGASDVAEARPRQARAPACAVHTPDRIYLFIIRNMHSLPNIM